MMYFKTNLPGSERAIRIAMAAMLASTGFIGFCPMCAMVGRKYIGTSKP